MKHSFSPPFWAELVSILLLAALVAMCSMSVNADTKSIHTKHEYMAFAEQTEVTLGLPPGVLSAVIQTESNWNPNAVGAAGEIGLGQIKPDTVLKMCPHCVYKQSYVVYGSTGEVVKKIQAAVGASVDGIWGSVTHTAVLAFQKKHGLTPDGVVGPKTWKALFNSDMPMTTLETQLRDPYTNMVWAGMYLVWLRNKLGTDDPAILVAGYNGGDANQMVKHLVKWRKHYDSFSAGAK